MTKYIITLSVLTLFWSSVALAQTTNGTKKEPSINQSNLTEGGTWARDLLNNARTKEEEIVTEQDRLWFVRNYTGKFRREVFFPTKGRIDKVYGVALSRRTPDDYKLITKSVKSFQELAEKLVAPGNKNLVLLGDLVKHLEQVSPHAREKRLQTIDELLREGQ